MNKIFLVFISKSLLVTLLILGVCSGVYFAINHVRYEQFKSESVEGVTKLLVNHYNQLNSADEKNAFLQKISQLFAIELQTLEVSQMLTLHENNLSQLEKALPVSVVDPQDKVSRIFMKANDSTIIALNLQELFEEQIELSAYLINIELHDANRSLDELLDYWQSQLIYPIELLSTEEVNFNGIQLMSLQILGFVEAVKNEDSKVVFIRFDDNILRIGPLPVVKNLDLVFTIVVVLLVLIMGSLFSYLFLKGIDKRLRQLEQASDRIVKGNLNARVALEGNDSVTRLAYSFNNMAENIQRLIGVQRDVIRAVSHELRTPVARIRFGLSMIEECDKYEDRVKQTAAIDEDIQELDELVDEILTYARLEEGGPIHDFEMINVNNMVQQVADEQSIIWQDKAIEPILADVSDEEAHVEIEARYIHRAIQNLVGNACRYANSTVKVTFSIEGETCRIDVEDDGAGIPEADWERVFTPFARLDDSRTRSSGGYGLGLSIVRRILYWHGGRAIVTRSAALGGAQFSLIWPKTQPESNKAAKKNTAA